MTLQEIAALQHHRGPDSQGTWITENQENKLTIGLGHQRLSILDLSSAANQPMISPSGSSVLVFNGEIYNFQDLYPMIRDQISEFESRGDTAVLHAMLDTYGQDALPHLNGMWAFVYFNQITGELIISRDRFGIKPLYFYCDDKQLLVTSEIKPILKCSGRKFQLNYDTVSRYLFQSFLNTDDNTFFEGITSFNQGSSTVIRLNKFQPHVGYTPVTKRFWRHPTEQNSFPTILEPVTALQTALENSIKRHLISDVPVGLFLSGGLDSSSLLALAKKESRIPPTCFSIISSSKDISEEYFIKLVSDYLEVPTNYVNADNDPQHYLDSLPQICYFNEQPVTSLIVAAHNDLVRIARAQGNKVLLTGQGIDEQLGGYNKYFYFHVLDRLKKFKFIEAVNHLIGGFRNTALASEFRLFEAKRYIPLIRDWVRESYIGEKLESAKLFSFTGGGAIKQRELTDLYHTSLPAILHYEDRMSMRHSCEMRVPFLDVEIAELLGSLPENLHLNNGVSKFILRSAMKQYLPEKIINRKDKKGFSIPDDRWIREIFPSQFRAMFSHEALIFKLGLAKHNEVNKLLDLYLKPSTLVGTKDIFNLYCLEVWLQQFQQYIC